MQPDEPATVEVTLAQFWRYEDREHVPGDVIRVPVDLARKLRRAGYAVREPAAAPPREPSPASPAAMLAPPVVDE